MYWINSISSSCAQHTHRIHPVSPSHLHRAAHMIIPHILTTALFSSHLHHAFIRRRPCCYQITDHRNWLSLSVTSYAAFRICSILYIQIGTVRHPPSHTYVYDIYASLPCKRHIVRVEGQRVQIAPLRSLQRHSPPSYTYMICT